MTVRFSSCQRWTTPRRSAVVRASMAVKGSSRRITGQSWRSSRANSTRWNCPADRSPIGSVIEAVQAHRGQSLPGLSPEFASSCHQTSQGAARARGRRCPGPLWGNFGQSPPAAGGRRSWLSLGLPRSMRPPRGFKMPVSPFNKVLLPEPLGPTTAVIDPGLKTPDR